MKKVIRMVAIMMALILCSMNIMEIHAEGLQLEITEIQKGEQREATDGEATDGEGTEKDPPVHVLLVGNSFTSRSTGSYTVEQPLEELARVNGHNLEVTTLVHNGARLYYFAGQSAKYLSYHQELTDLLANQSWDYVVFQEHTTVPIEEFDTHMYPAVEELLKMVKQSQPQATPLLYMTAGYENGQTVNVNGVPKILTTAEHQLYTAAANKTLENKLGVEAIPVGMHSLRVNRFYPDINMVDSDSKHPSFAGYYLAACAFYQRIYGAAPDPSKADLTNCNLTVDQLTALAALTEDSLKLEQKDITLTVNGAEEHLKAILSGTAEEASAVTFRSFDAGVAAVDEKTGTVTAKGAGSTMILAETSDGLQAFCNVTVKPEEIKEDPVYVLIVGNSFTRHTEGKTVYTVEEPLKELAEANGHNLQVTTLSHGGAKLRYYAGQSESYFSYCRELMQLLLDQSWDYIIFQEQTTVPIETFDTYMYPAVEALLQMVKKFQPKATPLLYMTAGYEDGTLIKVNGVSRTLTTAEHQLFTAVSYKTLENKLGVEVIPVGMHSLRANILYPEIKTVGPDSKHPSYAGYYLAACSFYQRIYNAVPNLQGVTLTNCNLTEKQRTALAALTADSLTMNQKDITLDLNKTASVNAVLSGNNTSSPVIYKSFNSNIASVNETTGVITAKSGGSTVIVAATSDGMQAFCNVTVRIPLSFSRDSYLGGIGDRIQILPKTNSENLKWSSSKTSVASVDSATGIVTAKASGRAVITVTNKDDTKDKASYTFYVTCVVPTGLKAASTGKPKAGASAGNIKITWNKVAGATGYEIYRSTSKSGTYKLIGTSKSASYTDKTASVNKYFYYKVKAANSYAECTSPLSVSTRGIIVKASKTSVKRVSKKYAKLTWKKNSKATGYEIYRSTKKNSGYKKIATLKSNSKVSYTDKKVTKKKTYYYRVKAYRKLDGKTFYGVSTPTVKIKI